MQIEYSIATEKSNSRSHNEDAATFAANQDGIIFAALCDGMGGHCNGEIASQLSLEYLKEEFLKARKNDFKNIERWINIAINKVHKRLENYGQTHPETQDMGTTLVGCLIFSEMTYIFNIGDSRAYFINDVFVKQLTEDQNLENYAKTKKIELDLILDVNSQALVSALGPKKEYVVDLYRITNQPGYFLLCSDGFYNFISETSLIATAMRPTTTKEKTNELITYVQNRTNDNATILMIALKEDK
ncbi:hypothetical protein ASO20_00730 [Mycoplasma sp. (ex Biomphalaria glabrata)]|uniref:PP2C family protein-serine/threonine phosphatase n=1 Tax=Mycoplasma sp. (ex Biomphalaria glabrata) TaxID=1749074 RepID=UPI00073AB1F6|nr:protein phosphatase 2C domain-containing protein [Mycoplasma sp. (ex Biomphalaria glabrata)]ALV23201.1 hypothetical protein ASO20_00730 [Mycoplasma sp. (ex Biomphalaria glabrata)]